MSLIIVAADDEGTGINNHLIVKLSYGLVSFFQFPLFVIGEKTETSFFTGKFFLAAYIFDIVFWSWVVYLIRKIISFIRNEF